MNTRLQQFITAENLSQSQFADTIGVARASVSHILAGRNKPGFDFIESMSRHYPSLNLEWLITGKGKMYKGAVQNTTQEPLSLAPTDDLFAAAQEDAEMKVSDFSQDSIWAQPKPVEKQKPDSPSVWQNTPAAQPADPAGSILGALSQNKGVSRSVSKIIIFYDDNSFQELK